MIIVDPIKDEENFTYNTVITYPKTTQISHGVYDNKVDMTMQGDDGDVNINQSD